MNEPASERQDGIVLGLAMQMLGRSVSSGLLCAVPACFLPFFPETF